jgi:hypothetical protein
MFSYTNDTPPHTIADNVRLLIEEIHEMFKRFCEGGEGIGGERGI